MPIRRTLSLGLLVLTSMVPLYATASPVAVWDAFDSEPMAHWSMRRVGIGQPANIRQQVRVGAYYYGNVFQPLTVWATDTGLVHSQPESDRRALLSWRSWGPVNVHFRRGSGHGGGHYQDDPDGHDHDRDDPGSNPSPVPLPASWVLLLSGVAVVLVRRRTLIPARE